MVGSRISGACTILIVCLFGCKVLAQDAYFQLPHFLTSDWRTDPNITSISFDIDTKVEDKLYAFASIGEYTATIISPIGLAVVSAEALRPALEAGDQSFRDKLRDGIRSRTTRQEVKVKGLEAKVLVETKNISHLFRKELTKKKMTLDDVAAIEERIKELQLENNIKGVAVEIKNYHNQYIILYKYKLITDIRISIMPEYFMLDSDSKFYDLLNFSLIRFYENGRPMPTPHFMPVLVGEIGPRERLAAIGYTEHSPHGDPLPLVLYKNNIAQLHHQVDSITDKYMRGYTWESAEQKKWYRTIWSKRPTHKMMHDVEVKYQTRQLGIATVSPRIEEIEGRIQNAVDSQYINEYAYEIYNRFFVDNTLFITYMNKLHAFKKDYNDRVTLKATPEYLEEQMLWRRIELRNLLNDLKQMYKKELNIRMMASMFETQKWLNHSLLPSEVHSEYEDDNFNSIQHVRSLFEETKLTEFDALSQAVSTSAVEVAEFIENDQWFITYSSILTKVDREIIPTHLSFRKQTLSLERNYHRVRRGESSLNYTAPEAADEIRVNIGYTPSRFNYYQNMLNDLPPRILDRYPVVFNNELFSVFSLAINRQIYVPSFMHTQHMGLPLAKSMALVRPQIGVCGFMTTSPRYGERVPFITSNFIFFYAEKVAQARYIKDEVKFVRKF